MTALLAMLLGLILLGTGLLGCAIGRVESPDGTMVAGIAVGRGEISCCDIPPPSDEGPQPKVCATVKGGPVSTSFTEALGIIGSVFAAMFTGVWL